MPAKNISASTSSNRVELAKIGATHGIRGDLKLYSHSGEYEHIAALKVLHLVAEGRELDLTIKKLTVGAYGSTQLISFVGYDTREAAQALVGMTVVAPRAAAAPLQAGEFYCDDLVGLVVYAAPSGQLAAGQARLGLVTHFVEGGPELWLEVALEGSGKSAIVPFRKEFVGEVDIKGKRLALINPDILE